MTGSGQYGAEDRGDWVWERTGLNYAVQGNALVSTAVVDSVAVAFERTEGSGRHLADRLIEALYAGQVLGGDGRHGRTQSAAVLVADPRPGMSRRQDGVTTDINVCEHPEPIRKVRRIYDTISETLGFRDLQQFAGRDVLQLKVMLHALGYYRAGSPPPSADSEDALLYDRETVEAVDAFRAAQAWQTSVPGWVDANTIARLWSRLEEAGSRRRGASADAGDGAGETVGAASGREAIGSPPRSRENRGCGMRRSVRAVRGAAPRPAAPRNGPVLVDDRSPDPHALDPGRREVGLRCRRPVDDGLGVEEHEVGGSTHFQRAPAESPCAPPPAPSSCGRPPPE